MQWRKASPGPYWGIFADWLRIAERKDASLVTTYVIADFDSEDGPDLLREATESLVCYFAITILNTPSLTMFTGTGLTESNCFPAQPLQHR